MSKEIVLTKGRTAKTSLALSQAAAHAEILIQPETNALRDDAAIVPIGDRILVRRVSDTIRTVSGIQLPDMAKEKAGFGVVIAAGQGRYNLNGQLIPLRVSAGAVICFGRFAGTDVFLSGAHNEDGKCVLLREEEVFFVVMDNSTAKEIADNADPEITPLTAEART